MNGKPSEMVNDGGSTEPLLAMLPITFIEPGGSPTADHVHGSPCLDITFMSPGYRAAAVKGLIDTGADYVYLDRSVISLLNCPVVKTVTANGAPATVHQVTISLPSLRLELPIQVCAFNVRAQGNGFDAILGRQFLQHGRLIFDLRNGSWPSFAIDSARLGHS